MLLSIIIGIQPITIATNNIISSGILSKSFNVIPSTPFSYPIAIIRYKTIIIINIELIGIIEYAYFSNR